MDSSVLKYLSEFAERLEERYGDILPLDRFLADAEEGCLNIVEDYSWLDEFAAVIVRIGQIVSGGHLHVKHVKELKKAELASRVDAEAFHMTIKDPRLWRNSDSGIRPESVYSNTFEDEHAIYENRFIKLLIDEIIKYLSDTLTEISDALGSLSKYFGSGVTAAGALRLEESETEEAQVLADEEDPLVKPYERVEQLRKKAVRFKNSILYRECSKVPPLSGEIQPTNILVKDPLYRACYLFYKKLRRMKGEDRNMGDALFNTALLKLFFALGRAGYRPVGDGKIFKFSDGRLDCAATGFGKGNFVICADVRGREEIELNVVLCQEGLESLTNSGTISRIALFVPDLTREGAEFPDVAGYRVRKLGEGYSDAFVLAFARASEKRKGVVNLADKGNFSNRALEDFVRGLALVLNGGHAVYAKKCPVCGARQTEAAGTNYVCGNCGSMWALVTEDGVQKVWVKRLRQE